MLFRSIYARNTSRIYGDNQILNRPHEKDYQADMSHEERGGVLDRDDTLNRLDILTSGIKRKPQGKVGQALGEMKWNRKKDRDWKDEWIDTPNPSKDDGDTGQDSGNTIA